MKNFTFDETVRSQIRKVVDYANHNIYNIDDLLDMKNDQKAVPGEDPEHLILVPVGRWVCYYIVDHPHKGRCHYFSFKPDASGKLPEKSAIEQVLTEFGIERPLLYKQITTDKMVEETNIILPFVK